MPLVLGGFLVGCATGADIRLQPRIPHLNIEQIPISAGLYISPELDSYFYSEDVPDEGTIDIDFGASQRNLFDRVFTAMFEDVIEIESFDESASSVDLILVPRIEEVQIATPSQTRSQQFEVWVKYVLEVYSNTGQEVQKWSFAAYGKVNQQNYTPLSNTREAALEDAAYWALRDAAATMSFYMFKQPNIRQFLSSIQSETAT